MTTTADGVEVVQTLEGTSLPRPPLLVVDRLERHLNEHGLGTGPMAWSRIGDGQSNVTYRIVRGTDVFVLRRGPRPPLPRSTHDMVREAAILTCLRPLGVPVPDVLHVCRDESVLGVPFYLTSWLDGVVITNSAPGALDTQAQRRLTSEAMVTALAQLHGVDAHDPEVARLGRPDGYLARQLTRFAGLWESIGGRDLHDVPRLAAWLERHRPEGQRSSVVHGDFRLGNLMFRSTAPASLLAILDWEMATLGDPLSDLGYLVATYTEPGTRSTPLHLSPVTAARGYLSKSDITSLYADLTGLDVSGLQWYQVLALWKAAVFCEAIYTRWLRGERPNDHFGPRLEAGVPALLAQAALLAE